MSKRWTMKEDLFLAEFYDVVGDYAGSHDLGRPRGAAKKRVEQLRACGAWDVLKIRLAVSMATGRAYRAALGLEIFADTEELAADREVINWCKTGARKLEKSLSDVGLRVPADKQQVPA